MKILFIILFLLLGIINLYSGSEPFWEEVSVPSTGFVNDFEKDSKGNLYIAAENGLWKSTNLGDKWFKVLDGNGFPDKFSKTFDLIDVNENDNMAVVKYKDNYQQVEILLSTDFGDTWNNVNYNSSLNRDIIDIQINDKFLYVLVLRNAPRGDTIFLKRYDLVSEIWESYSNPLVVDDINGFKVINDSCIIAFGEDTNRVHSIFLFKSPSNKWTIIENKWGYIHTIDYYKNKVFIGCSNGLLKLEEDLSLTKVEGVTESITCINFKDNDILLGTKGQILYSKDGGSNWDIYLNVLKGYVENVVRKIVRIDSVLFMYTRINGIFRSFDNGENWETCNNGFNCSTMNDIAFSKDGKIVYLASKGLYKSTDYGDTWELIGFGGEFVHTVFVNSLGHIFYTSGIEEGLMRSTDEGKTWVKVFEVYDYLYEFCENSNGDLFATSLGFSYFYRSFDNGETWEGNWIEPYPNAGGKYIALNSEEIIFITDQYGEISVSEDNGISWKTRISYLSPCSSELGILFVPNTSYGYASYGQCLLFTEDNGWFWVDVINDKNSNYNWEGEYIMAVDSTGMILVQDEYNIHRRISRKDVFGNFIENISEGVTDYSLDIIEVSPDGYIWAATDYGGVYRSKSPVVSIEEIDLIISNDITISPNPATDILNLSYSASEPGTIQISLLDILGRKAIELPEKYTDSGIHKELIDISSLNSGIYFISVRIGSGIITRKVVVSRY